jgi:hypothetical protein
MEFPMPNVILLDIDDCLSTDRSILACTDFDSHSFPGYRIPRAGDRVAIGLINRACAACTARIVVSSLWVGVAGPEYTLGWLARNGLHTEHLMVPDPCLTYRPEGGKLEAIDDWLERNPAIPAGDIAVVDDDRSLFPADHPLADRQVVVGGEDGVLLRHYRDVITRLGASDREAGVIGPWRFDAQDD